jgi:hypothetical protein
MAKEVVVRSGGYVALCAGFLTLLLVVSVGAILDPASRGSRDPDWMFWLGSAGIVAALCRAPFVGLLIRDERVTRRSWVRTRSWSMGGVTRVETAGYSGNLNRYSRSGLFLMLVLHMHDGSVVEVPEVSGVHRKMNKRLQRVAYALHLPAPSEPGSHRIPES